MYQILLPYVLVTWPALCALCIWQFIELRRTDRKLAAQLELWSAHKMKSAEDWMMVAMHHAKKVRELKAQPSSQVITELQDYKIAFRTFAETAFGEESEGKTFGEMRAWISDKVEPIPSHYRAKAPRRKKA